MVWKADIAGNITGDIDKADSRRTHVFDRASGPADEPGACIYSITYSLFKAVSGSSPAARKAGSKDANRTTTDRTSGTAKKTLGS